MLTFLDKKMHFTYHLQTDSASIMTKEKFILSVFALLLGIVVAVVIFYLYQSTKQIKPTQIEKITLATPTPAGIQTPLILSSPKDQSVVTNRSVTVSGKTDPDAKIVVLTQSREIGAVAAGDGSFSTEITLDNGQNIVEVLVVSASGKTATARRTVTYSTEEF